MTLQTEISLQDATNFMNWSANLIHSALASGMLGYIYRVSPEKGSKFDHIIQDIFKNTDIMTPDFCEKAPDKEYLKRFNLILGGYVGISEIIMEFTEGFLKEKA